MTNIAIRVENLSKLYRIGVEERRPQGVGQAARSLLRSLFAYLQRMMRPPSQEETLWALKDVSFEACPELYPEPVEGLVEGFTRANVPTMS